MKYLINLFPEKEKNVSEKIIYFAFHYLRYILVITQFVTVCVFFYRFMVDQEIADLKEKLNQEQSVLLTTSELVKTIQDTDLQMKQIESIMEAQKLFQSQYTYVLTQKPAVISIENLQITTEAIDIQGSSAEIAPIRSFYDVLQAEKRFRTIDLSAIEKSDDRYLFTMRLAEFSP